MTTASDRAAFEIIEDALSDRYRILACTRGKGMSGLYEAEDVVLRRKVGSSVSSSMRRRHPRSWRRRRHDFIERPKSRPSFDALFSQNIGDGAPGYGMAEIREGAAKACIPPLRIRLRHPYDELANLGHDPGPSELFLPLAVVPLPRDEPSVPSQKSFRCDDTGDLSEVLERAEATA